MSDHPTYGYPPAAGYGAYLLIRGLISLFKDKETATPTLVNAPIVTPPPEPARPAIITPPPQPVRQVIITPPVPHRVPQIPIVTWSGTEELLGWRAWRLAFYLPNSGGDGGPRLLSLTAHCIWNGPVVRVAPPSAAVDIPSGIFAFQPNFNGSQWQQSEAIWVTGLVGLSGRVVEHAHGYRAERAVVRELRLATGTHLAVRSLKHLRQLVESLENRYQVTVEVGQREREVADCMLLHGQQPTCPKVPFVWARGGWRLI